jgi:hypothetical protein
MLATSSLMARATSQGSTARWAFSQDSWLGAEQSRESQSHLKTHGAPTPQQLVYRLPGYADYSGQSRDRPPAVRQEVFAQHLAGMGGVGGVSALLVVVTSHLVSVVVTDLDVVRVPARTGRRCRTRCEGSATARWRGSP